MAAAPLPGRGPPLRLDHHVLPLSHRDQPGEYAFWPGVLHACGSARWCWDLQHAGTLATIASLAVARSLPVARDPLQLSCDRCVQLRSRITVLRHSVSAVATAACLDCRDVR